MKRSVAGLLVTFVLSACASVDSETFLHTTHREQFAIQASDFQKLQFYISKDVLAHAVGSGQNPRPEDVIVIPLGTPGLVIEAGQRWLLVRFSAGGEGVYFLASHQGTDSAYLLATETEGGLVRVSELPDPVLVRDGRRYRILNGPDAYLRVDVDDLHDLIESRPHAPGLRRD